VNGVYAVCVTAIVLGYFAVAAWRQSQRFEMQRFESYREVQRTAVAPAPVPSALSRLQREQIVVTMKTGETFSGVLWEETEREIILRAAAGVSMDRGNDIGIDGELLIFVTDIAYVQKP
jgi:hypothetical protein